ncbi:MAG: GntR family transcriptional regulator [Lentisphaeria bacterium]|nr:GntR family transcriptional regulator [Lentisphaeria bacterium]
MTKSQTAYQELKRRLNQGIYLPMTKLPGEVVLAKELGISRVTLRTALKQLIKEGFIVASGRSGNYVSEKVSGKKYLILVSGYAEDLNIPEQYIISALRLNLSHAGHSLEVFTLKNLEELSLEEWNRTLINNRISGVFLLGDYAPHEKTEIEKLNKTAVPMVKLLSNLNRDMYHIPAVIIDERQCFLDGVRHLAMQGHKRIATIFAIRHDGIFRRGLELEEYKEFLRCNGLCDDDSLILHTHYNETKAAVKKLLLGIEPPTAFMCFCDTRALQVYAAAKDLKLRIPHQLSVMGMCGYSERLFALPKLSVVNFHYDRICGEAVKLILHSQEWFDTPDQNDLTILIPHTVEDSDSTTVPFGMKKVSNPAAVKNINSSKYFS